MKTPKHHKKNIGDGQNSEAQPQSVTFQPDMMLHNPFLSSDSPSPNPWLSSEASTANPFLGDNHTFINPFLPTAAPIQAKADVAAQSQASPSSPQKLPDEVAAKMSDSLGMDFTGVNIHQDSSQAKELGAHAFTQGNDIHFAQGQYQPDSPQGQALIGHELTHVVQQSQGRVNTTTQMKGLPVNDSPALEQEADTLGAKAAQMPALATAKPALPAPASGTKPVVQASFDHKSDEVAAKGFSERSSKINLLKGALDRYGLNRAVSEKRSSSQINILQSIIKLANAWIEDKKHNSKEDNARKSYLQQIVDDAKNEIDEIEDAEYTEDVKSGKLSATIDPLQESDQVFTSNKMSLGKLDEKHQSRFDAKEQYKLRPGELTAMVKFTESGGSYKYMKPAYEGIDSWLEESLLEMAKIRKEDSAEEKKKIMDTHREQGKRHMEMALKGVPKLPMYKGKITIPYHF